MFASSGHLSDSLRYYETLHPSDIRVHHVDRRSIDLGYQQVAEKNVYLKMLGK